MPKVRKPFISGEEFQSLLDWIKGTIRVIHGKGQKERSVPFDKDAQRVVLRYLNQRSDSEPWLWVGEERRRLQYYGIGQDILRMMQRAKVDVKDAMHVFRRAWAASAVRQGIPRPYVQGIAGWSTPTMMDHYVAAMQLEEGAIEAFREFKPFGA